MRMLSPERLFCEYFAPVKYANSDSNYCLNTHLKTYCKIADNFKNHLILELFRVHFRFRNFHKFIYSFHNRFIKIEMALKVGLRATYTE